MKIRFFFYNNWQYFNNEESDIVIIGLHKFYTYDYNKIDGWHYSIEILNFEWEICFHKDIGILKEILEKKD